MGVRGLHGEITSVVWLRGVAVSEIKSLNGRIGTHKTEAGAETLLCVNYICKSRCKPLVWQLLCFVAQWTMSIFSVWTFQDYKKCTLVIRLVSDPSVVSFLVRNWKSFLFLPAQSWEGPLSHPGLSQPSNRPFCWKFLWHGFLSWLLWCSQNPLQGRQFWCTSFFSPLLLFQPSFCVLGKDVPECQPQLAGSVPLSSWKLLFPTFLCYFSPASYLLLVAAPLEMSVWNVPSKFACTLAIKCKFPLSVCCDYFK